jgi:hypothetical protein
VLNTCECFNLTKQQWIKLAPLNHGRCESMAFTFAGMVYVAGGYKQGGRNSSIEVYNKVADKWTVIGKNISLMGNRLEIAAATGRGRGIRPTRHGVHRRRHG